MVGSFAVLVGLMIVIVPLWRICGRAGFSPALSLFVIVPVLGFVIVSAVLGFANWPNLKNRANAKGA